MVCYANSCHEVVPQTEGVLLRTPGRQKIYACRSCVRKKGGHYHKANDEIGYVVDHWDTDSKDCFDGDS